MNTLRLYAAKDFSVPAGTSWYLADLGEFRGKEALYTQQSPQRLKTLREHALIESAVSSNRIEGVSLDPARVRDVLVAPKPLFRDRDEEEVRGNHGRVVCTLRLASPFEKGGLRGICSCAIFPPLNAVQAA